MAAIRITRILLTLLLSSLTIHAFSDEATDMEARIKQQMSSPDRHEWDLRRDIPRKPFETFDFLGLKKDMVTLDVGAYAGYTTEMLAAAVGPDGKVYMQNTQEVIEEYANGYYDRTISQRLANNRLPNVALHIAEYGELNLHDEIDMAFLGNLIHDFYNRDGEENTLKFLASIRKALKPGGILGVMDHAGDSDRSNGPLHRIDPSTARGLLTRAGFTIEAESRLFENPADDHSLMVYDETIYLRTDKFLFRAISPD